MCQEMTQVLPIWQPHMDTTYMNRWMCWVAEIDAKYLLVESTYHNAQLRKTSLTPAIEFKPNLLSTSMTTCMELHLIYSSMRPKPWCKYRAIPCIPLECLARHILASPLRKTRSRHKSREAIVCTAPPKQCMVLCNGWKCGAVQQSSWMPAWLKTSFLRVWLFPR